MDSKDASPVENAPMMDSYDDDVKKYFEECRTMWPELSRPHVLKNEMRDCYIFVCYKSYEDSKMDSLPKLLNSTLFNRRPDMKDPTNLIICGGWDGIQGDILVFPGMMNYRGLKESTVASFVDDVLVNGKPWEYGAQETLSGAYVFVCAHGTMKHETLQCGPTLIQIFKEQIKSRELLEHFSVYSFPTFEGFELGDVIIFGKNSDGDLTGTWYGYVCPDDVPGLIDRVSPR